MSYRPDRIIVEKEALEYPFCQKVLTQLSGIETQILDTSIDPANFDQNGLSLSKGKRILHLKKFKGNAFKLCPGFTESILCCNYYVLDLVENCPLECSYCILQAFLNKPLITFHVNIEEIIDGMVETINKHPNQPFRIGTGEHSDSLALDQIFNVNPYLVERFSTLKNATLELKTKTDAVDNLLGLNHCGRTVIAWSLNPPEIIKANEHKTADLHQRLQAAVRVSQEGYKVAFHFDPLIHYPEWKQGYKKTVETLFEMVDPESVAWISLGTLRYIQRLKQISEERFPKTGIFSNEFVPAQDGKMRYIKPIRKEMLTSVSRWLSELAPQVPLYFCMEHPHMWSKAFKKCPATPSDLEFYLSSHLT